MIRHGTAIPIGEGATSRVCKAWDESRASWVAIKYLLHPDPTTRLRLMREARAVSALEHPHLCPVLEVGEEEGRHYILMPFLDGPTLAVAAPELDLEARVRLMAQVADAVHHAHEQGLLHRDLKPENIVVTREHGLPHAWVLDFGLVREIGGPSITTTGQVLGTPAFMSPEQARGESLLDRRSDVFALGAVLHWVLTQHSPFEGPSTAETLMRVIQDDPPRLRSLRRDLPPSLEAIVGCALEKSPQRRYDSARAFGADLRRFLAGQIPLARLRWADRLRRAYRQRPLLFSAGATLALTSVAVLVLSLYWSAQSAERARVASERAASTEAVRQSLRLEYLRPLHDVSASITRARASAHALDIASSDASPAQRRAELRAAATLLTDTGDIDAALDALQRGAALGPDARIARMHALLLMRAHRAALSQPQPFSDAALRARLRAQAERRYLLPARALLSDINPQFAGDWMIRAESELALDRPEQAIATLEHGFAQDASAYEALLAAAEIHIVRGVERHWATDADAAGAQFAAADAMLTRALEHGRSDPRLHRRRCELAGLWLDARPVDALRDTLLPDLEAPCRTALQVLPSDPVPYRLYAHLLSARARIARRAGTDALRILQQSIAHAERALELAPDDPRAAQTLALALIRFSVQQRWTGEVDLGVIERAVRVLQQAASGPIEAGVDFTLVQAQAQGELAQSLERLGRDPTSAYEAAIARFRLVVERVPEAAFLRLNLASALSAYQFWRALQGRPDPALVEEAISELQQSLQSDPDNAATWSALADSHWDLAMTRGWRGDDSGAAIARADELYDEALRRAPDSLTARFNRYNFELFVAREALRHADLAKADKRIAAAAELARQIDARRDDDWITPCPRAELSLIQLERSAAAVFDTAARKRAQKLLDGALERQPEDHDCGVRRVRLAATTLPHVDVSAARREWEQAHAIAARHPASLEMKLARLALLTAAHHRGDIAGSQSVQQGLLLDEIRSTTAGAWRTRLAPFETRDGGDSPSKP